MAAICGWLPVKYLTGNVSGHKTGGVYMKYIAFDLGASSGKMMLGSFDGNRLDTEVIHRFPNCQISANGSLYWNFLGIYQNLIEGLKTGFRKADGQIAGLGMDSYCNDFGLIGKS